MTDSGISEITKRVDQVDQFASWFAQNFVQAPWKKRLTLTLVLFSIFGSSEVLSKVPILGQMLPWWYSSAYWGVISVLFASLVALAAKGLQSAHSALQSSSDAGAVRGLLPFGADDKGLFSKLQRDVEIAQLIATVRDPAFHFGILYGTSGSGKTSFLRAGLAPALRDHGFSVAYIEITNADPIEAIQAELARQQQPVQLLVLDQFEQFFFHQRTREARQALFDRLEVWHRDGPPVLISIRAEDLSNMHWLQEKLDYQLTNQNFRCLPRFTINQATTVLTVLCHEAGVAFEPAFVEQLIETGLRDATDGLVSPVDLAIVIFVLASNRKELTPDSFKELGGLDGLLGDWLDSQLAANKAMNADMPVVQVLTALCDFEMDRRAGALTLRQISDKLDNAIPDDRLMSALEWLQRKDVRLVTQLENSEDTAYQLSHERWVQAIRKVAGRMLDDAARANTLLDRRVREWAANNRARRFLLSLQETWQILRQRPYLIWGELRAEKETLLRRSAVRAKRLGYASAGVAASLIVVYLVWISNAGQRQYINWRLNNLAHVHPSQLVAAAIAAAGSLNEAERVVRNENDFFEDEEEEKALGEICNQSAKTAISKSDKELLDQTISFADNLRKEGSLSGINAVIIDLAKAGRADDAIAIIQRLDDQQDVTAEEWTAVGIGYVQTNRYQEAIRAASRSGEHRSDVVTDVCRALVRDGKKSEAIAVADKDASDRDRYVTTIAVELAKNGKWHEAEEIADLLRGNVKAWSRANRQLADEFVEAGRFDDALELMRRSNKDVTSDFEKTMLVEMAIRGRKYRDRELINRVRTRANGLKWDEGSYERWMIEAAVGDPEEAKQLLAAANIKSIENTQQGHSIPGLADAPMQMAKLAGRLSDHELMADAIDQAISAEGRTQDAIVPDVLSTIAEYWGHKECEVFLEEMLRRQPQLSQYNSLLSVYMSRFGNLKRARELAESYGNGGKELAQSLAAIVLEDERQQRPTILRDEPDRISIDMLR